MIDNILNKLKQYYNILDLMNNGIISKEYDKINYLMI